MNHKSQTTSQSVILKRIKRTLLGLLLGLLLISLALTVPAGAVSGSKVWLKGSSCGDLEDPLHDSSMAIASSYCVLLGRLPDPAGLRYWSKRVHEADDLVALTETISFSPEFKASDRRSPIEVLARLSKPKSDPLRKRVAISAEDFSDFVSSARLVDPDFITPAVVHARLNRAGQRINVVMAHISAGARLRVSPESHGPVAVGRWASQIGAVAAVNGNWFGPWDGPAVSNGVVYGGSDHVYTSLMGFTEEMDLIVEHHEVNNLFVDTRIVEGVAGHPTLVYRGKINGDMSGDPTFTRVNPRTAIGVDKSGDVIILVTVDGRSEVARGMTGVETAKLMRSLGAFDSIMLDGGGSTAMWLSKSGIVNRPSDPGRRVGNQIAIVGG